MYRLVLIISSLWFYATLCESSAVAKTSAPPRGPASPLHEEIDRVIDAERVGPPAPLCTDAEFLRRVYLDLAGKIPTAEEAAIFLKDTNPDKRNKLVDTLLEQPHFDRNFMRVLDVMLMERRIEISLPCSLLGLLQRKCIILWRDRDLTDSFVALPIANDGLFSHVAQ